MGSSTTTRFKVAMGVLAAALFCVVMCAMPKTAAADPPDGYYLDWFEVDDSMALADGMLSIKPTDGGIFTDTDGKQMLNYDWNKNSVDTYDVQYDCALDMSGVWSTYEELKDLVGEDTAKMAYLNGNFTLSAKIDPRFTVDKSMLTVDNMEKLFKEQIGETFAGYFTITDVGFDDSTRLFTVKYNMKIKGEDIMASQASRPEIIHFLTPSGALKLANDRQAFEDRETIEIADASLDGLIDINRSGFDDTTHYTAVDIHIKNAITLFDLNMRLEAEDADLTVARLFGSDRFSTAAAVGQYNRSQSDVVFLASGEDRNWPDALTAAGGAGLENAPIVLTPFANTVGSDAMGVIKQLGAKKVVICGGSSAVSAGVENQLKSAGYIVVRLGGDNRMQTAEQIYNAYNGQWTGKHVVVCTSMVFADALAISPYSYYTHSPILLTDFSTIDLTPETRAIIKSNTSASATMICGGTSAVGSNVDRVIAAANSRFATPERIFGDTRYETSAKIADYEVANADFTASQVAFARGQHHADALVGGALQGMSHAPLMLVDPGETSYAQKFLSSNDGTIVEMRFFGGTSAVSEATSKTLIESVHYKSIIWMPSKAVKLNSVLATNPSA